MATVKTQKSRLTVIIRWFLALLILAVLMWSLYIYLGKLLSQVALGQIAELTNTKIKIESINFHADGSIFIEDLVISPIKSQNVDATIINAKKVYASFDLGSLFLLKPRLKLIDVNDFTFNAQYDLETGWSNLFSLKMKPPKGIFSNMPRINLKNGTVLYSKISEGQEQISVSVPLDASFGPDEESQEGYIFDVKTATLASGFGTSRLTGIWKPGIVTFTGGISTLDVPELEMAWHINVLAAELKYEQNNDFSLKLRIRDLQSKRSESLDRLALLGPAFLERSGLFASLQGFFRRYQPLGLVDIEIDAEGNFSRLSESTLAGRLLCKDVAFCYSRFPYAIEHLAGQIDFTKNSATLNNLAGWHDGTELFFNGRFQDFGPNRQYQISITSDNIPLDSDLYDALSAKQKDLWTSFAPSGDAMIDLQLNRQSQTEKKIILSLELCGVDATYSNFPYPLKNLTGMLSFTQDSMVMSDVISQQGECQITLNGEIMADDTEVPLYDIFVEVKKIPLNSTLEDALPDGQQSLYRQIRPAGFADGFVKVWTQDAGPTNFTATVSFSEASLRSEKFSLPITNISAQAVFEPDLIVIKDFAGMYGESPVSLAGQIQLGREQQYNMSVSLEQMQLDDELFILMPESLQELVFESKPNGSVNIVAQIDKKNTNEHPDYVITVDCLDNKVSVPGFPFPLEGIRGSLLISDDNVAFRDVTASISPTSSSDANCATIKIDGQMELSDETFGNGSFGFSATDVVFDERIAQILPQRVRNLYNRLAPYGRFDLDFNNIRLDSREEGLKSIDFVGEVSLKNCGLNIAGAETELNVTFKTNGLYETKSGLSNCQTILDGGTIKIHGKSFTGVRADVCYDPGQQSWFTEGLVADLYGGKATGQFELRQPAESPLEHVLQLAFENVDLKQFLADARLQEKRDDAYTSGKMKGSLSIKARVAESSSRIGTCWFTVTDMQVGKLSPIGKLLQVLNLTKPSDFAFDRMFVDSYIQGNGLFIKKLDLSGQGIAFYGSGSMDVESRNVDLNLTARGRRLATEDPSILQSLAEGLGQAIVRIEVAGDYDDPIVTTRALPVIEETLNIIGTKPE